MQDGEAIRDNAAQDDSNGERLRYPIERLREDPQPTPEKHQRWIDLIEALPGELRALVQDLSDRRLDTPYRPGGWTIRQVVHHLADSHMNGLIVAHAGINRVLVAVLAGLEARLNDLYQPHDVIYRIGRAAAPPVVHELLEQLGVVVHHRQQGLHRLDARQRLVYVPGVQRRLVVAGLELARVHQEAVANHDERRHRA